MHILSTFLGSGTTTMIVFASFELPVKKDCKINGQVAAVFSTASGDTYSPCCSLNIFLILSIIINLPYSSIMPTSPVLNHPFSKLSSLASGLLNYFKNVHPPLKQISPFQTLNPFTWFSGMLSDV
jgi:hypothetical protein